jgi:acyl-CoA dehydrogenase
MNFDFSDELKQLRDEARKFLGRSDSRGLTRAVLEGRPADPALWTSIADMGWLGASIPEEYGGLGLGPLAVCVLAEELGYAVAAWPFVSSVYLATEALVCFGTPAQKARWLPLLASGRATGTFALAEGTGPLAPAAVKARADAGLLSGCKLPVSDGLSADFAIVVAQGSAGQMLHLVDLAGPGVARVAASSLDLSRPQARLDFDGAPAEALASTGGWDDVCHLLDRAAVLMSFEQVGGAQAALEMARDYAIQRYAFGKPIASFQAIKHKLADVYVAIELSRSNAYYGAWALGKNAPELATAAASARISATDAAWMATRENVQTHGGMGYTWELDCHLYYRRAKYQALVLGSAREWKRRLLDQICPRTNLTTTAPAQGV